jgi:cytochrome c-type biogenesis protein CcmF
MFNLPQFQREHLDASLFRAYQYRFSDQAWAVRIYIKPFVQWIWVGCLMMAGGGFLALLDPRYRRRNRGQEEAVA